jgi:hypothetical protein
MIGDDDDVGFVQMMMLVYDVLLFVKVISCIVVCCLSGFMIAPVRWRPLDSLIAHRSRPVLSVCTNQTRHHHYYYHYYHY